MNDLLVIETQPGFLGGEEPLNIEGTAAEAVRVHQIFRKMASMHSEDAVVRSFPAAPHCLLGRSVLDGLV